MKQKLTLLILALFCTMGAWATSPAAGAYPVEGKQYYIFAIQSSGSRTYLYNSSNSLALNQGSKENSDAYKWTVTISGDKYVVKNVANTSYYLGVNSVLALTTSSKEWSLGKSVSDPACVSLYYDNNEASEFTGGIYYVTNSSGSEVSSGMYLTSKNGNDSYTTNGAWTASYVFEEVLSAHTLTDGRYYTIYCDNDSKQYIYDNAGTLAQASSAPDSDLKYVWQCIVNGDYYNFRNLQTGKYLGWRAISASAYNYTITTTQAIHDGCATMWSPTAGTTGRNWSIKNDGTLTTGQTSTKDDKVNSIWSTDFRFDEVDLSSWCTGDLLGGSMSGTDNWTNTWTSGTTPQFTLTAGMSDINNKDDRKTGGLDIRSGSSSAGYDTYTITAPTGYLITGYKIVGYALNGDQTVTPSKGGDATVFTTAGNSIYVSGLRQGKASFKLSGANDGLFIRALQVSLTPMASSITSLPTTNDKAYVIYNARAVWNFVDNATSMNAVALENMDLDNEEQQIALIYHNENYYLYSVNAGMYLTASNTLTPVVTDNEQISITATGNATYPWFFKFKNVANKNINIDGNRAVQINYWSTLDDGNRNAIVEVADFDATEALAMFNNRYVTYNLSYGGNDTFRTKSDVVVAPGGKPADYVPDSWKAAYCTLTYDVETIEESTTTVNVTATWDGPFEFSTDYASAKWYYLKLNNKYVYYDTESTHLLFSNDKVEDPKALWAFFGNPYDGVKVANLHVGDGLFISNNDPATMHASSYVTNQIGSNAYGFYLHEDKYFMADIGGGYIQSADGTGQEESSNVTLKVEPYIVTYNLKFGGSTIATKTLDKVTGDSKNLLPTEWTRDFCTYSYEPAEIGNSTTSVDVTMTWNGPFDISADYENAIWYYLAVNGKWGKNNSSGFNYTPDFSSDIANVKGTDGGQWAFFGNPYDGFLLSLKEKYSNTIQVYLTSQLENPAFSPSNGSTEKWIVERLSGSTFTLNCGDKYLVDNSTTMAFKTTTLEGSEGTLSVRSYYCQNLIDDIYVWADANHRDEYFGPSETSLTTLTNNIATYFPKMTQASYEGYTLPAAILNDIVVKYPVTGYYRIKNNETGNYLAYGQPVAAYNEKNPGLIAISSANAATDASSIIKLTGSGGTYKLSTEDLNVQSQTTGSQAFPATSSEGVDFVFTSANKNGIVSITNAASHVNSDNDGSLHEATDGWTVHGVVNWSASAANSKWTVEDATDITLTLNAVGENTYGTTYLPFGVMLPSGDAAGNDVVAYTLTDLGNGWARLVQLGTDGKSIPADTPVLLKGTTTTSLTATIANVDAIDIVTNALRGTYVSMAHGENLVLGKKNDVVGFYEYGYDIKPNKAYIPAESGVKGLMLDLDDDPDAISFTPALSEGEVEIYNVAGQRLQKMQKGINIVNGKKILK